MISAESVRVTARVHDDADIHIVIVEWVATDGRHGAHKACDTHPFPVPELQAATSHRSYGWTCNLTDLDGSEDKWVNVSWLHPLALKAGVTPGYRAVIGDEISGIERNIPVFEESAPKRTS